MPHDQPKSPPPDPWPRRVGIALGIGVAVALLVAVGLALAGVPGGLAAAAVLGILTLVTGGLALVIVTSAVLDERAGARVPWRRLVMGIVLLVAAVPLGAMALAALTVAAS